MARMRRIQVVIDPELDDRLEQEAAARGISKSALVRASVEHELSEPFDNGLWKLVGMFDVEPIENIDEFLYGPISEEAWPSLTRRSGSPKP
jgi:Ribbon-helix-helix protein, copG family